MTACVTAGGTLMVVTRATKRRGREVFYTCNNHRRRGPTVCGAEDWLPEELANRLVLEMLADDFMRPDVVSSAVERALARIVAARGDQAGHRERLQERLDTLDLELRRLIDSLAGGVAVASISDAIATGEVERQRVRQELVGLETLPVVSASDRGEILTELEALRLNWREVLQAEAPASRQLVKLLPKSRARFYPEERDGVLGLRVEAEGTLRPLLAGKIWVEDGKISVQKWRPQRVPTMSTRWG